MENKEINLLELVKTLLYKWWIVLLAAVTFACGAFSYTKLCITPTYNARVTFFINNSSSNISGTVTEGELQAGKTLLQTYTVILKSRSVLEAVSSDIGGKYSYSRLSSMISAGAINQTDILAVQVTSTDAADAHLIADSIAKILPEKISAITGRTPPTVVDAATTPQNPSAPNTVNNAIMGFLLGAVIACAAIVIFEFINDKFRTPEHITARYKAPLLAAIPDLVDKDKEQKYSYYKQKNKAEGKGESDV